MIKSEIEIDLGTLPDGDDPWEDAITYNCRALRQMMNEIKKSYQNLHPNDSPYNQLFNLEFTVSSIGSGPNCEYQLKYTSEMEDFEILIFGED